MSNLTIPKQYRKAPAKARRRAVWITRYVRVRGPVRSARDGAIIVRHRRGLRAGVVVVKIGAVALTLAALAAIASRRRQPPIPA